MKIHGRWVNLVELEERLASAAPGLKEAAAVLVPDVDGVDAVAFFFAADDERRRAALPCRPAPARCRRTSGRAGGTRWRRLPRGPTGKLLRRKLRELHDGMG